MAGHKKWDNNIMKIQESYTCQSLHEAPIYFHLPASFVSLFDLCNLPNDSPLTNQIKCILIIHDCIYDPIPSYHFSKSNFTVLAPIISYPIIFTDPEYFAYVTRYITNNTFKANSRSPFNYTSLANPNNKN